jgi:hypothetical protein
MVKKKYFFESYFFPNLKNNYWDTNEMSEKRDKLLMEALLQHAFKCKITNIFPIPKDRF